LLVLSSDGRGHDGVLLMLVMSMLLTATLPPLPLNNGVTGWRHHPALVDSWQDPLREKLVKSVKVQKDDSLVTETEDGEPLPWNQQVHCVSGHLYPRALAVSRSPTPPLSASPLGSPTGVQTLSPQVCLPFPFCDVSLT
jgi:hypothetical protein